MKRSRYRLPHLLFAALVSVAGSVGAQDDPPPVVLSRVDTAVADIRVEAVGESRAERSVTLYPESTGVVTRVDIEADASVEAGDVLVTLESRAEENAVARARAELRDQRRRLARYESGGDDRTFSPTTLDDVRRAVELARLELERARIDRDDRRIVAPFSGHTGMTDIEVGDRIDTDTAVTTLDDRRALRIRFRVAGRYFDALAPGDEVSVQPWARPDAASTAIIDAVDSRIDPATGTFALEARVDNADDRLRPGMRFRVTQSLTGPAYPQLPSTGLQWGDNGAYVWRIRDGAAERVGVALVRRRDDHVLVDGGLSAGDRVVSEGAQRMRPGIEVRVIDAATLDDYPAVPAIVDASGE